MPDPANPQAFNRYSYCLNNPLKYIDPSGYQGEDYDNIEIYPVQGGYQVYNSYLDMWVFVESLSSLQELSSDWDTYYWNSDNETFYQTEYTGDYWAVEEYSYYDSATGYWYYDEGIDFPSSVSQFETPGPSVTIDWPPWLPFGSETTFESGPWGTFNSIWSEDSLIAAWLDSRGSIAMNLTWPNLFREEYIDPDTRRHEGTHFLQFCRGGLQFLWEYHTDPSMKAYYEAEARYWQYHD